MSRYAESRRRPVVLSGDYALEARVALTASNFTPGQPSIFGSPEGPEG